MVLYALGAFIALLVAFKVPITGEQKGAVLTFMAAVLALWNRSRVQPVAPPTDGPPPPKMPTMPPPATLLVVFLLGCGVTPRDATVNTINAASHVGAVIEPQLAAMYRSEQTKCLALTAPASPDDCVATVRERYAKAWQAYDDFLADRNAVVTLMNTFDNATALGTPMSLADVVKIVATLGAAGQAFANAVATVQGVPIQ